MVNSPCANPYSIAAVLPIIRTGLVPFEAKLLHYALVEVVETGPNTKYHDVSASK